MNGNSQMVSVTDFVRNFSSYVNLLPRVREIVLMRDSQSVAIVKAPPRVKNTNLKKFFGIWKGTALDNDELWEKVLTRRNRKKKYSW